MFFKLKTFKKFTFQKTFLKFRRKEWCEEEYTYYFLLTSSTILNFKHLSRVNHLFSTIVILEK